MADASMVRTLAAQAEAIWPQEKPLFERYRLPDDATVLDAGCATGEITYRVATMLPRSRALGIDIIDSHLEAARTRCAALGPRAVSCLMTRASGNSAASMARVSSVDASSTTTISLCGHVCSRALRSAWRSQSRRLRVGTMMETLSLKSSRRPNLLHAERPFLAYLCY